MNLKILYKELYDAQNWRSFKFKSADFKFIRTMKLIAIILLISMSQVSAKVFSQEITLSMKNSSLETVLTEIRKQSGYKLLYNASLLSNTKRVTLDLKKLSVKESLDLALKGQQLGYIINDKAIIIVRERSQTNSSVPTGILQQQVVVRGVVVDRTNTPMAGVTILEKGTQNGTTTKEDGTFVINVSNITSHLIIRSLGYQEKQVEVSGGELTIMLEEDFSDLEEVVVVGYGTQKRSDLTGAISRIDARDFENQSATNLGEFLSGTVAGISSSQGTKASGGASLEIRGTNSIKAGTSPLIVLDGVIYNGALQDINPFDITSIDVLQDASSAAVYGARAASGVIIVTTKKGTSEVPSVTFSTTLGVASTSRDYKPFDGVGYLNFRKDLMQQMAPRKEVGYYFNPDQLPENVTLEQWRGYSNNVNQDNTVEWLRRLRLNNIEIEGYQQGRTFDWYDKRMQNGMLYNSDISLSGKGNRVNYYLSTGYTNNKGIIFGDQIKTWRTRLNLEGNVASFLKVGLNSQFANSDNSSVQAGGITSLSPFGVFDNEDGTLVRYPQDDSLFPNPFLDTYYKDQLIQNNRLFATFYGELKLPFGIKYRISFQNRLATGKNYNFWPSNTITGGVTRQNGYGNRRDEHSYEWMVDNIVTWSRRFGKHAIDLTLLANAEKLQVKESFQENENFQPNENLSWHGLQYGLNPSIENNDKVQTGDALMARMNYNLDDRYLFTLSWRRDGFSAFGQNHPRGFFPSAAFAWRVSQERFFNTSWVDDLKLRLSWGVNGNRDVSTYAALSNLSKNPYFDGTNVIVGLTNTSMANPNLKWEGTEAYNMGVDLSTFGNKLNFTIDAYKGTTHDLLLDRMLPKIIGYVSVATNLGRISNKGINATVDGKLLNNENLSWRSSLVFSLNRNRIDRLWGDMIEEVINGQSVIKEVPDYANEYFPGQALDRVWDYKIVGIWQEDEIDEAKKYGLRPGEYKAEDVNTDFSYRQMDDKQFLGWTKPRFTLGWRNDFNFLKYFDVNIFLRADLGHIGKRGDFNHPNSNTYDRSNALDIPYWTSENRSNSFPRLNVNYRLFEGGISMYESRSFLRLQDIGVGYKLPSHIIDRVSVDQFRFFISARNLLTLTKWTGWDPEAQNSPMPRSFTMGLNVSF